MTDVVVVVDVSLEGSEGMTLALEVWEWEGRSKKERRMGVTWAAAEGAK